MKKAYDRDLLSGLFFIGFGASVVIYAGTHYSLGNLSGMDAGYFPVMLGGLLILIGLIVMAVTFYRKAEVLEITIRLRPLLAVLGAILLFALTVERLGLLPAVMGMTLVAAAGESPFKVGRALALGACLGALAWLVFVAGLGMSLSAFNFKGQ